MPTVLPGAQRSPGAGENGRGRALALTRELVFPTDGELYVLAASEERIAKQRSMRRRQLKWLWRRLKQLSTMRLSHEALLMELGAAQAKTRGAW